MRHHSEGTAMSRRTNARLVLPLALVVAAPLLATCSSWASPPIASRAAPAPSAVRAPAAARPHTIYISLSHDVVSMPSTLRAGTYYVQVRTTDARNGVTVVRPPSTLTPATFYARYRAFDTVYDASRDPSAALHRYRTSGTFVSGASTVAGKVGAFAIRLTPGRYFFFTAGGSDPVSLTRSGALDARHVKVVTVVGPAAAPVAVPTVGIARFDLVWPRSTSVTLPSTLPRRGFLLAVGGRGLTGGIWAQRLLPGVTDTELHDGTCLADGLPAPKVCFDGTMATLGGAVSPGASAWFYYDLPPGDYAVGSGDHTQYFDSYFTMGLVQRVHVA
jgi:hypothetical protein